MKNDSDDLEVYPLHLFLIPLICLTIGLLDEPFFQIVALALSYISYLAVKPRDPSR